MTDQYATALLQHIAALEQRVEAADKLWKLCVAEGFPWSEGSVQDELTELGFLVATDMTGEDEAELCKNCEGECRTCYRPIKSLAAYRAPQPRFTCASCAHQWDEDTIWCPKCRNGYRNPQPKEPT